jgi:hypothetical protein
MLDRFVYFWNLWNGKKNEEVLEADGSERNSELRLVKRASMKASSRDHGHPYFAPLRKEGVNQRFCFANIYTSCSTLAQANPRRSANPFSHPQR